MPSVHVVRALRRMLPGAAGIRRGDQHWAKDLGPGFDHSAWLSNRFVSWSASTRITGRLGLIDPAYLQRRRISVATKKRRCGGFPRFSIFRA